MGTDTGRTDVYVDAIDLQIMESFPIQVAALVRGNLSNGCVVLDGLSVTRTDETVRFSVPESTVEIKLMRGLNGKPITIDNLPSPVFHDYRQYESVVHAHASADAEWSYAGTNGFTSQMIAKG